MREGVNYPQEHDLMKNTIDDKILDTQRRMCSGSLALCRGVIRQTTTVTVCSPSHPIFEKYRRLQAREHNTDELCFGGAYHANYVSEQTLVKFNYI